MASCMPNQNQRDFCAKKYKLLLICLERTFYVKVSPVTGLTQHFLHLSRTDLEILRDLRLACLLFIVFFSSCNPFSYGMLSLSDQHLMSQGRLERTCCPHLMRNQVFSTFFSFKCLEFHNLPSLGLPAVLIFDGSVLRDLPPSENQPFWAWPARDILMVPKWKTW